MTDIKHTTTPSSDDTSALNTVYRVFNVNEPLEKSKEFLRDFINNNPEYDAKLRPHPMGRGFLFLLRLKNNDQKYLMMEYFEGEFRITRNHDSVFVKWLNKHFEMKELFSGPLTMTGYTLVRMFIETDESKGDFI